MKTLDRRQWLRSAGLSSGFLFLGGLETMALDFPARAISSDKMVELNANENPYGPSKKVRAAITNSFDEACRYPFKIISSLEEMIAEKEGVPESLCRCHRGLYRRVNGGRFGIWFGRR